MRQTPFTADPPDDAGRLDRDVADVGRALAQLGIFGLIWLDRDLVVTETFGRLVDFATKGDKVTEGIVALIGLESEIKSLEATPERLLELPAVSIADGEREPRKLNFTIHYDTSRRRHLVLVYRTSALTDLERELSRQIRARLMAEEAVEEKSRQLARANADLESFAAIVSHDLKSPLRHIRFLAEAAARHVDQGAADLTRQAIGEINRLSARVSGMLTALFDYSSLGRKYEASEVVDTADLVRSITSTTQLSGFKVMVEGDWPRLQTLRAPLDLVLRNLISNAAKHHDRGTGTIVITGRDSERILEISVADDGLGIGARDQPAIFLPFRSLGPESTDDSSGMGLAMVLRAVESVGGGISIASNPELTRGTTFTVRWPKQLTAEPAQPTHVLGHMTGNVDKKP